LSIKLNNISEKYIRIIYQSRVREFCVYPSSKGTSNPIGISIEYN